MPRRYLRKPDARPRGTWTEEDLLAAFKELKEKKCSFASVSHRYGIPSRTLIRRFKKQDATKLTLGKHPLLKFENEDRIVSHVQRLEEADFPVTRKMMRRLAYELAEACKIDHNFDAQSRIAGIAWLRSFLDRHPELGVRRTEDLTIASHGLNREQVDKMSEHLIQALIEHDLLNKPERTVYKMNKKIGESGYPEATGERKDKFECTVTHSHLVTIDLSIGEKNSEPPSPTTPVTASVWISPQCEEN